MMMDLYIQYRLFISSLLIGVYLGVTYDLIFHFISSKLNKTLKFLSDILFFIIQGIIVFRFMYKINHAVIPLYTYILFLIGYLTYNYFAEDYYDKRIEPLQRLVKKAWQILKRCLYWGFVEPYVLIINLVKTRIKKMKIWLINRHQKRKLKRKENKVKRKKNKELKNIKRKKKKEEHKLKLQKRKEQKTIERKKKNEQKMLKKNKSGDRHVKKQIQSVKRK